MSRNSHSNKEIKNTISLWNAPDDTLVLLDIMNTINVMEAKLIWKAASKIAHKFFFAVYGPRFQNSD